MGNIDFFLRPQTKLVVATMKTQIELENVAINDVLPLKTARRDAIANLKCFWWPVYQQPNFDGFIYIHYAAPP